MIHYDNWLHADSEQKVILKGYLVKISNGDERFYVTVVALKAAGEIVGRVSNVLVTPGHAYNMDDLVAFRQEHAIEVWTEGERVARAATVQPTINALLLAFVRKYVADHGRMPTEKEGQVFFETYANTRLV